MVVKKTINIGCFSSGKRVLLYFIPPYLTLNFSKTWRWVCYIWWS